MDIFDDNNDPNKQQAGIKIRFNFVTSNNNVIIEMLNKNNNEICVLLDNI